MGKNNLIVNHDNNKTSLPCAVPLWTGRGAGERGGSSAEAAPASLSRGASEHHGSLQEYGGLQRPEERPVEEGACPPRC